MILKQINDIASVCAGHGIETAVISPGSRSAPLSLAFDQHPDIDAKVIGDERSAGFIALGIAQQQGKPVVLICTSGSAVFNYAPAIAEAFYQEIPLIVISADRPPEWINQYDGQTIQQSGIFGKHVKASFDFPAEGEHKDVLWHGNRIINEAIIQSKTAPRGPVHINVPLREPFYPESEETISFDPVRLILQPELTKSLSERDLKDLAQVWNKNSKRLIVVGQSETDKVLSKHLSDITVSTKTPVISDVIGNQQVVPNVITNQDAFLQPDRWGSLADLSPDLLITVGKSLISKNLKLFLRKHPPKVHWHIHDTDRLNDTLQNLTFMVTMSPAVFFEQLKQTIGTSEQNSFFDRWIELDSSTQQDASQFLEDTKFGEFQASYYCLKALPDNTQLHLANSMSVRYANLIGLKGKQDIHVCANRGTSGIDGSNAAAVGAALSTDSNVTLLTGDMAFFYDRNAFWHAYDLSNLRVIILNNHGGGIFRMIKGPQDQPGYEKLFETDQPLNAENTAKDHHFEYASSRTAEDLNRELDGFFSVGQKPKILEIFSDSKENAQIMASFKKVFSS